MEAQHEFHFQARLRWMTWGQTNIEVAPEIVTHIYSLQSKIVVAVLTFEGREVVLHNTLHKFEDGTYYMQVGAKAVKQLGAEADDILDVRMRNDDSPYQCEFPEAMREVLALDPEAKDVFDSLKPATVRGFLYWVMGVRGFDKQIERALAVTDALKAGVLTVQKMVAYQRKR